MKNNDKWDDNDDITLTIVQFSMCTDYPCGILYIIIAAT